jgi:hypothetical protein
VQSAHPYQIDVLQTHLFLRTIELHHIKSMSDQNMVIVNVEKGRRDSLLKGRDMDRPFVTIRMPVSSSDRRVSPLKIEFSDVVACLKANLAQLSNALDQRG